MSGAVAATSVDDRVLAGFSAISVAQLAAAHVIDGYIQRLHVNVTAAVADFSSCVGSLEIALAAAASDFRRLARASQRRRSQRLAKQEEELCAVDAILSVGVVLPSPSLSLLLDSLSLLSPLVGNDALPYVPLSVFAGDASVASVLAANTSVWDGQFDASSLSVTGNNSRWCALGVGNSLQVVLRGILADRASLLIDADVSLTVTTKDDQQLARDVTCTTTGGETFNVVYRLLPTADALPSGDLAPSAALGVTLFGNEVFRQPITVGGFIQGQLEAVMHIKEATNNAGLAITADGSTLAIANSRTHEISLFSMASLLASDAAPVGVPTATFGGHGNGPGQYSSPQRLAYGPSGHLFNCDYDNNRVIECTATGVFVREIGVGVLDSCPIGLDVNSSVIAVGKWGGLGKQIFLFDMMTGALIISFGDRMESSSCHINGCWGLRIAPDGASLLITEKYSKRITIAGLDGTIIRRIGVGTLVDPYDAAYSPNGQQILVADITASCVYAFAADGSESLSAPLLAFGTEGVADGRFKRPRATAFIVHSGRLYVLDQNSRRVQVFV